MLLTPTGIRQGGATCTLILVALIVVGCSSSAKAPVVNRGQDAAGPAPVYSRDTAPRSIIQERAPDHHVVRPGDTLQAIAFRYRIDARDLARWNRIRDPDLIVVGQRLSLSGPPAASRVTRTAKAPATSVRRDKARTADGDADARRTQAREPRRADAGDTLTWQWPARGSVQTGNSPLGGESIQILGSRGQPIVAAEGGTVVYSGSGLRGYGKLIIVKHNESFLSAYAHNDSILVSEGASVKAGQQIAEMGNTESDRVMLHFEIRKNGKAVEPRDYLPERP